MDALIFKGSLKQLLLKFSTVNAINMKPNLLSQITGGGGRGGETDASLERNLHLDAPRGRQGFPGGSE